MIEQQNKNADKMATALNGQYNLNAPLVIKEAWNLTIKNFAIFAPSIAIIIAFSIAVFSLISNFVIQTSNVAIEEFLLHVQNETQPSEELVRTFFLELQQLSYVFLICIILLAPLLASALLMALNHSIGGKSQIKHLMSGFYKALPLILMTVVNLLLQTITGYIFTLLSFYVMFALSMAPLLICERGLSPWQALWVSFRAVNKKLLPILGLNVFIYMVCLFAFGMFFVGIIFAIPFYFHLQAVLYREMFGLRGYPTNNQQTTDTKNDTNMTDKKADNVVDDVFDA